MTPEESSMNALRREIETFRRELPSLLGSAEGKFVLIIGDQVVATYDTYSDALKVGYEKAGVEPFLVKCVTSEEDVAHFSRPLRVACLA
jgi:hypothetical protein